MLLASGIIPMVHRRAAVVLVMVAISACSGGSDGRSAHATDAKAEEAGSLERWKESAEGGDATNDVIIEQQGGPPCTMVKIGDKSYAALWPKDAVRTDDGVRLDGELYRFDTEVALVGHKYDGPPTFTRCVAVDLWMILGAPD